MQSFLRFDLVQHYHMRFMNPANASLAESPAPNSVNVFGVIILLLVV
jgi:hypothetical protein